MKTSSFPLLYLLMSMNMPTGKPTCTIQDQKSQPVSSVCHTLTKLTLLPSVPEI